jgi:hypothetical protein
MRRETIFLCSEETCCPRVEFTEEKVYIGEEGNICVLTREQWNSLVDKVLSGQLTKI